jgi:RimJ/RimL family protein N-acetyltransferase
LKGTGVEGVTLSGKFVRLEPLDRGHLDGLVAAAAVDPTLYRWSLIPQGKAETSRYIDTALAGRDAGTALPFATICIADGAIIGSTRFFDIERWAWPRDHARYGLPDPDVCEIGYTWLTRSAIRTAANTEAKLLMLTHAFEAWQMLCVCLHTDARNQRSRAAIERIGGKPDGILRAHRMGADFTPRDSVRFSILAEEWPDVKRLLGERVKD